MKRRLAAILVGDVVGYSAMVEADEEGTRRIDEAQKLARARAEQTFWRSAVDRALRAR
jgi:hypothetical protein